MSQRADPRRDNWTPALASATLLLVGSAIPLPDRYNPDTGLYGPDKLLHLVGHASLVALLGAAVGEDDRHRGHAAGAIALSTGLGLVIEVMQDSVPGREFESGDVAAGLIGSVVGLVAYRR